MIRDEEMIVDLFAGGGGASVAILQATGRHPDLAVNHDADAIAVHTANHPTTRHEQASVWKVEPRAATGGRPVGLLWASPDCRHFSRASGGRPRWKSVRSLPGVVLTWATRVRPRIIMLENVSEFLTWGPLLEDGTPCPQRIGRSFKTWAGRLRGLGYQVEWRELCAADFGAPTIRNRLFVVARCDGEPVRWPEPTHGREPGMFERPWRSAAECIEWDVPAPSIFDRPRPLVEATCRRIAAGIQRFVLNAAEPFVVHLTHHGPPRVRSLGEPLPTITTAARGEMALVAPTVTVLRNHATAHDAREPLRTVAAQAGHHALVAPTLVTVGWGEREGQAPRAPGLAKPLGTIMAGGGKGALVAAFLAQHNGGEIGRRARDPLSTIVGRGTQQQLVTAELAPAEAAGADRVAAFLIRYNGLNIGQDLREPLGTSTTKHRFALVHVAGVPHAIVDIGMRMLLPSELARAQALPEDYRWIGPGGGPLGKTATVRLIGNSVSPPPAVALLRANLQPAREMRRAA